MRVLLLLTATLSLVGCAHTFDVTTPSDVLTPDGVETMQGSRALYAGAVDAFAAAYGGKSSMDSYIATTGLFTDEFQAILVARMTDARARLAAVGELKAYEYLQKARVQAQQAITAVLTYPGIFPRSYVGELYALEGYSEILLAELYCSGIPLSTTPLHGDVAYQAGSTTTQVLEAAVAHFDTAMVWATDSARIMTLVQVGKGRALLDLGRYAEAAQAVAGLPTAAASMVTYSAQLTTTTNFVNVNEIGKQAAVANGEGGTGMLWVASADPRVPIKVTSGVNVLNKYINADAPIRLADGIEARLIEAEADLAGTGTQWRTILNTLRTNGTFTTKARAGQPGVLDTTWNAGTGGVAGLSPLADPGTDSTRVDLLFRERGFWLFATGHRQGDLRRLIRQYGRDPNIVYPNGVYRLYNGASAIEIGFYETAIVAPVPLGEQNFNRKYQGCFNQGA